MQAYWGGLRLRVDRTRSALKRKPIPEWCFKRCCVITFANPSMDEDLIILDWRQVDDGPCKWGERWAYALALYAVVHPRDDEIIYLGKADGCTVRSRWNAADKHERVWQRIEKERGLREHCFIVGEFRLPKGWRLTRELVCDVESLLIFQIKPGQTDKTRNPAVAHVQER